MNCWDISETEASIGKSDDMRSSYRRSTNSEANVSLSLYQTEKQGSAVFPPPSFSLDEKWVKEYMEQFGQEPSFF